jgi:hypothetical protein
MPKKILKMGKWPDELVCFAPLLGLPDELGNGKTLLAD